MGWAWILTCLNRPSLINFGIVWARRGLINKRSGVDWAVIFGPVQGSASYNVQYTMSTGLCTVLFLFHQLLMMRMAQFVTIFVCHICSQLLVVCFYPSLLGLPLYRCFAILLLKQSLWQELHALIHKTRSPLCELSGLTLITVYLANILC